MLPNQLLANRSDSLLSYITFYPVRWGCLPLQTVSSRNLVCAPTKRGDTKAKRNTKTVSPTLQPWPDSPQDSFRWPEIPLFSHDATQCLLNPVFLLSISTARSLCFAFPSFGDCQGYCMTHRSSGEEFQNKTVGNAWRFATKQTERYCDLYQFSSVALFLSVVSAKDMYV